MLGLLGIVRVLRFIGHAELLHGSRAHYLPGRSTFSSILSSCFRMSVT